MPPFPTDDVAARVAEWHNRHPLARRIQPSQVHSIGEVTLPFASDRPLSPPPPAARPAVAAPSASMAAAASASAPSSAGLSDAATSPATATPAQGPDLADASAPSAEPPSPAIADFRAGSGSDGHDLDFAPSSATPAGDNAEAASQNEAEDLFEQRAAQAMPPPAPEAGDAALAAAADGAAEPPNEDAGSAADLWADALAEASGTAPGAPAAPAPSASAEPEPQPEPESEPAAANTDTGSAADLWADALAEASAAPSPAPSAPAEATEGEAEPEPEPEPEPEAQAKPEPAQASSESPSEPAEAEASDGDSSSAADLWADALAEAAETPSAAAASDDEADVAGRSDPSDAPGNSEAPDSASGPGAPEDASASMPAEGGPQAAEADDADPQPPASPPALSDLGDAPAAPRANPAPGSLAERLQAARRAALGDAEHDGADAAHAVIDERPSEPAFTLQVHPDQTGADGPDGPLDDNDRSPDGPQAPDPAATSALLDDLTDTPVPDRWWRRWLARWFGVPVPPGQAVGGLSIGHAGALAPLFGNRVLWPIQPAAIARWAQRHASPVRLMRGGPHRAIDAEPQPAGKGRRKGMNFTLGLHARTAAIGIGDRRLRVLIGPDGEVLGARAMDPTRVAAAAVGAAVTLALAGWLGVALWARVAAPADGPLLAQAAAAGDHGDGHGDRDGDREGHTEQAAGVAHGPAYGAASAADHHEPAHGAASATHAADPAHADAHPAPASGAHGAALAASSPLPTSMAAAPVASTPGGHAADPSDAASTSASTSASASTSPSDQSRAVVAAAAASRPFMTTTPPPAYPVRRASGPVANIRPQLSAEQREAARSLSEAARQSLAQQQATPQGAAASGAEAPKAVAAAASAPPPAGAKPDGPRRYAVVVTGGERREPAEAHLAQMMAVKAQLPSAPARLEVVQQHGLWHAAQWPFESEADARRASELLAARGLQARLVPF